MYGYTAESMRRCTGVRRDGSPCRAWAEWRYAHQRCVAHGGRTRPPRGGASWPYLPPPTRPARYTPCRCLAYAWPHRPASGLCRWPDEPIYRRTTPAGTHRWPRKPRGKWGAFSKAWDTIIRARKMKRLPRQQLPDPFALLGVKRSRASVRGGS